MADLLLLIVHFCMYVYFKPPSTESTTDQDEHCVFTYLNKNGNVNVCVIFDCKIFSLCMLVKKFYKSIFGFASPERSMKCR